jgi:undecaprenyl-diphosphatase
MNTLQAIILAIIEGITEFLPVSSTAHLKFTDFVMGYEKTPFRDMFEVMIQLPAILAIVVLYWKKFFDFKNLFFYFKLIIAVIPALIFGVLFKKHIESALGNLWFISVIMIVGGVILIFIDNFFKESVITDEKDISYTTAIKIGFFQVLSIVFPGLSRSAATIIGGMSQKLSRKAAAEFSFFLAVPTMIAASAKSFYDACKGNYLVINNISESQEQNIKISLSQILSKENLSTLFTHSNTISFGIGCVLSFIVAVLAVKFFIEILNRYGFKFFGIYRIVLGFVMLILLFLK